MGISHSHDDIQVATLECVTSASIMWQILVTHHGNWYNAGCQHKQPIGGNFLSSEAKSKWDSCFLVWFPDVAPCWLANSYHPTGLEYLWTLLRAATRTKEVYTTSRPWETSHLLWNPKFYHHVHKVLPLDCNPKPLESNSQPISLRSILILSSHLCQCLPSVPFRLFPSKLCMQISSPNHNDAVNPYIWSHTHTHAGELLNM